jgi:hypothetical protein
MKLAGFLGVMVGVRGMSSGRLGVVRRRLDAPGFMVRGGFPVMSGSLFVVGCGMSIVLLRGEV